MSRRSSLVLSLCALVVLTMGGCWTGEDSQSPPVANQTTETFTHAGVTVTGIAGQEPSIEFSEGFGPVEELDVSDITEGTGGRAVTAEDTLTVHYVGAGEQSRKVFDSSWPTGEPAQFPLGGVIEGWQEGMLGMREGGRRLMIIPGSMAYGEAGRPPAIGSDETLVFVVDLIVIQ